MLFVVLKITTMLLNRISSQNWNIRSACSAVIWIHISIFSLFLNSAICGRGRHYIVTSVLIEPYLMINPQYVNHTGNDRYTGYIADLMKELSTTVGIQYRLRVVKDGKYGTRQKDGSWDGMIGELIRNEANIAAAPLYITKQRNDVVKFSSPFLTVEATVILSKDQEEDRPPIRTAKDLLHQKEYTYGTLNTGITVHAFKNTNDSDYKQMFQNMKDFKPSVFTDTNLEGIDRAKKGPYAFVVPSTIGEYIAMQAPCDLKTVDRFLMKRHFALAVPKNSYIVPDLDKGLAILKKRQTLQNLYKKWWFSKNHCSGIKSSSVVSYNQHYAESEAVSINNQNVKLYIVVMLSLICLCNLLR